MTLTVGYPMYGLGNIGLGGFGPYSSYDSSLPATMGMNSSLFNMGGMNMMNNPMYTMYNPLYMTQMQQQIEASQLQHSINMHGLTKDMEVANQRRSDNALIEKILTNGDVQNGIKNLCYKVREGEQDGVREEFDKLKSNIYSRYKDELVAKGSELNPEVAVVEIIERLYREIAQSDLESDIRKYGENALENGFKRGFRNGHSETYVDETINHCFGRRIDNKGSQDFTQGIGMCLGSAASVLEKGVYGGIAGATAYTGFKGLEKIGRLAFAKKTGVNFNAKSLGKWGLAGAGIAAVADIVWQIVRD